jgi:hypothetical protein
VVGGRSTSSTVGAPAERGLETLAAINSLCPGWPQQHLSRTSGDSGNLAIMQPIQGQPPSHRNHLAATGPAVEDHGRVVTSNQRAAAYYRQAQQAVDLRRATTALRRAVNADRAFGLALADLGAITGTAARGPGHRQMNWERHHIEVVRAAAPAMPCEQLTCSANSSPASAATLSPSTSPSSCDSHRHGRVREPRRPASVLSPDPMAVLP